MFRSDISSIVDFNWSYRRKSWPHVHDAGTGRFKFLNSTVNLEFVVNNNQGKPKIELKRCIVSLHEFGKYFQR